VTWQLRRAHAGDLDGIMALETRLFENDAWSAEGMLRDVTDPDCYYLVAVPPDQPDRIEAYAGLLAPRGALEGDIQTIAVTETARRNGLGGTLVQSLITEARKRGIREVFLEVRADNPGAQRVYLRLGFEEIGVRRGYYQPDNVDALVMRLAVPPAEAAFAAPAFAAPIDPTDATEATE
jgi:ribosomal-protein-alanine acetyltransferase